MSEDRPKQAYSRKEVRRVLGISEAQLRSWERQQFVPALNEYSLSDLIPLRTLQRLRESGVRTERIRRTLAALRENLRGVADPLRELKIYSEGRQVAVVVGGQKMEPESGQLLFDFDREEIARLLSFPKDREPERAKAAAALAQKREAEEWFEKGLAMEQTGAPLDEIIRVYETAIALDERCAGALVNLGTIYYHLRNWAEAEKWYLKALDADDTYALAHFNLGNLYDERGDRELALHHYRESIRLNPSYADAHYNLALLFQSGGDAMDAVRHWKIYLKLDGGTSWAVIARRELEKLTRAAVVQGARSTKNPGFGVVS